jgi:competence protein ComEA
MNVLTHSAACWIALTLACVSSVGQAQPPESTAAAHAAKPCGEPAAVGREPIELNSASAEQLERLPGIGPTRARAILELRARLKRFTRLEDLLRVRGIGRATFRKLRPLITLHAAP